MKLVKFLSKLVNQTVTIELKNGSVIIGTLIGVDVSMNTHLKTAKLRLKGKADINFDHFTVRGNNIRYFILPEELSLEQYLVDDTAKYKQKNNTIKNRARGKFGGNKIK